MKKIKLHVFDKDYKLVRTYTTNFNETEGMFFELEAINRRYAIDENGEIILEIKSKKDETKKD